MHERNALIGHIKTMRHNNEDEIADIILKSKNVNIKRLLSNRYDLEDVIKKTEGVSVGGLFVYFISYSNKTFETSIQKCFKSE